MQTSTKICKFLVFFAADQTKVFILPYCGVEPRKITDALFGPKLIYRLVMRESKLAKSFMKLAVPTKAFLLVDLTRVWI